MHRLLSGLLCPAGGGEAEPRCLVGVGVHPMLAYRLVEHGLVAIRYRSKMGGQDNTPVFKWSMGVKRRTTP